MRPLFDLLSLSAHVVSVDWPGFGEQGRPDIRWTADALSSFLDHMLRTVFPDVRIVVAAGHAASYVLHHGAIHPGSIDRLALIAPTWRGPLPTMAGGDRPLFARIRRAVESPIVGPALYRANVNPAIIHMMAAGHVYSEPDALSGQRLAAKRRVIDAPGARFGSAAFVTGGLDRVTSRTEFLDLACKTDAALMIVYGAQTPPKSHAEMEALARLPGIRACLLPKGKLAVHEEYPDQVASALEPFLFAPSRTTPEARSAVPPGGGLHEPPPSTQNSAQNR